MSKTWGRCKHKRKRETQTLWHMFNLIIIMLHFYRAIFLTSQVIQRHPHINKNLEKR